MTPEHKQLIRDMYPKAPAVEQDKLIHLADEAGLDAVQRQVYLIERKGKWAIQSAIDGFRAVASRNGLAGIDDAIFTCSDKGAPLEATVSTYKWGPEGQKAKFTATARWSEYNAGNHMWKRMPHTMLGKCAEALALRKGFSQLSGMYTSDEMDQAGPADTEAVPTTTARKKVGRKKAPKRTDIRQQVTQEMITEAGHPDGKGDIGEPLDVEPPTPVERKSGTTGDGPMIPDAAALGQLVTETMARCGLPFPSLVVDALGPDTVFSPADAGHRKAMAELCVRIMASPSQDDVDAALTAALKTHPQHKAKLLDVIEQPLNPGQQMAAINTITKE